MKLELKNIKARDGHAYGVSAYTATLYVDGVRAFTVATEGAGDLGHEYGVGGTSVSAPRPWDVDDWIKANLPKWSLNEKQAGGNQDAMKRVHDMTLDLWIAHEVRRHQYTKDFRKRARKYVMWIEKDDDGIKRVFATSLTENDRAAKYDPVWAEIIEKEIPDAVVLNTLPLDEAVALYTEFSV